MWLAKNWIRRRDSHAADVCKRICLQDEVAATICMQETDWSDPKTSNTQILISSVEHVLKTFFPCEQQATHMYYGKYALE